jgi:phage repressor protein C with HTH and peptisase S24 domain
MLKDRIRQCSELAGSGDALARKTSIPRRTLETYLTGKTEPKASRIEAIARAVGVSVHWLVTGDGPMFLQEEGTPDESPWTGGDEYTFIPPCNGHVDTLAGSDQAVDWLAFRKDWLRRELHANAEDLYLIEVNSESMEPTLRPGDTILVDRRNAQTVRSDGIYVLHLDGALLVKRLQPLPGRKVRVISDNPAYEAFELDLNKTDAELALIGRIVWAGRRI